MKPSIGFQIETDGSDSCGVGGYAHLRIRIFWGDWEDMMDEIKRCLSRPETAQRMIVRADRIKSDSADNSTRFFSTGMDGDCMFAWQSNRVRSDDYSAREHPETIGQWVEWYGQSVTLSAHRSALALLGKLARWCDASNNPRSDYLTPSNVVEFLLSVGAKPITLVRGDTWNEFVLGEIERPDLVSPINHPLAEVV